VRGRPGSLFRAGCRVGKLLELRSARTAGRPVASERARPQAKTRAQRGRNVAHRRMTVAAAIVGNSVRAQPNTPGQTIRIDTLHRPSRHVLHPSPFWMRATFGRASGDAGRRILLPGTCGVKQKRTRYRGMFSTAYAARKLRLLVAHRGVCGLHLAVRCAILPHH
jgi:hypothetical protein